LLNQPIFPITPWKVGSSEVKVGIAAGFYRLDALHIIAPTASKHWIKCFASMLIYLSNKHQNCNDLTASFHSGRPSATFHMTNSMLMKLRNSTQLNGYQLHHYHRKLTHNKLTAWHIIQITNTQSPKNTTTAVLINVKSPIPLLLIMVKTGLHQLRAFLLFCQITKKWS